MIRGSTPISDCFLTDQRNFSNEVAVTSRIAAHAKFNEGGSLINKEFVPSQSSQSTANMATRNVERRLANY